MRKGIAITIGAVVLCAGTYVLLQTGAEQSSEKTASVMAGKQNKENKSPVSSPSVSSEDENQELTFIRDGYKAGNQNGYYYFSDDRAHIKYFDYESRKEIYLCNKPNCNHDSESCSSYLNSGVSPDIFADENFLYLTEGSSDAEVVVMNANEENEMNLSTLQTEITVLYRMNLDGTEKTKLYECPSGVQMGMPYLKQGNILYAQFTVSKQIETNPNSYSMVDSEKKLVKINLETGEYEEVADTLNKEILGAYGNKILWMETLYKQNPNDFINDDQGWRDNLYQSTARISLFDPRTGQETMITEDHYKNLETITFDGLNLYVISEGSQKVEKISIENKERSVFAELPKSGAYVQDIYDRKLQYVYYDLDSDEAKVESAGYINLDTGENQAFTLIDDSGILVEILDQTDTHYFVRTGYKMSKEYTTWAGTKQRDIEETYYGLIRKEDYWNSKAEYLPMETMQN